ncbi:2Fe-2S iron-sulfur cluster-binding protein [Frankia sp. QA3]|uniref:2Fe-2S iron-sulfur cluster-binding protein n=1 Tax=Frankia sp. QA3 TaxID=710111 RepID=UPI000269BE5B|nr:2Fe-2S iron-sulfur cluster-binding protein [Frankia sp. QA3]EIV92357.1 ferredoxin [Frankia sp. QA3]
MTRRPARVRVEPAGIDIAVAAGESVFAAALRSDLTWPTICYGQARCTACVLRVVDGHQNLGPLESVERGVLRQLASRRGRRPSRDTRLACRLTVTGDVTVEKKGAQPNPPGARPRAEDPERLA